MLLNRSVWTDSVALKKQIDAANKIKKARIIFKPSAFETYKRLITHFKINPEKNCAKNDKDNRTKIVTFIKFATNTQRYLELFTWIPHKCYKAAYE